MGDWTGLPEHLLDLILGKITSRVDYLQFGTTCFTWHCVAKVNRKKLFLSSPDDHEAPMLLVHSNRLRNSWRVYDVMRNKFLQSQQLLPTKGCLRFSGSSRGWLASVSSDYSVTLHKCSFTNNHEEIAPSISLPVLFPPRLEDFESESDIPPCEYHVHMVLLTTDPLVNPRDCTVVVTFGSLQELAFIRLGRDTSWTMIANHRHCHNNLLYHNNKFYASDGAGRVTYFDIPKSGDPIVRLLPVELHDATNKWYLVTSPRGELWCIARYATWIDADETPQTIMFKLFRLEDDVDSDNVKLVEIESLDDVALFLGDNSSISVVASNHFGCKANTIYFAHDIDSPWSWSSTHRIHDFGLYEVNSRKFKFHCNMTSFAISQMSNRQPVWVIPSLMNL